MGAMFFIHSQLKFHNVILTGGYLEIWPSYDFNTTMKASKMLMDVSDGGGWPNNRRRGQKCSND